jgi:hypothetical protein
MTVICTTVAAAPIGSETTTVVTEMPIARKPRGHPNTPRDDLREADTSDDDRSQRISLRHQRRPGLPS